MKDLTDWSEFWGIWQEAEKQWKSGDLEAARKLFTLAVQYKIQPDELMNAEACLMSWAHLEAEIGNRVAFEDLWRRGTAAGTDSKTRIEYAQILWHRFKDAAGAVLIIDAVEQEIKFEKSDNYREYLEKKIKYQREWWQKQGDWPFKP